MHYRCPKCHYETFEYSVDQHACPQCGERFLLFEHVGFRSPTHWVMIDTVTNKVIGIDLCDYYH